MPCAPPWTQGLFKKKAERLLIKTFTLGGGEWSEEVGGREAKLSPAKVTWPAPASLPSSLRATRSLTRRPGEARSPCHAARRWPRGGEPAGGRAARSPAWRQFRRFQISILCASCQTAAGGRGGLASRVPHNSRQLFCILHFICKIQWRIPNRIPLFDCHCILQHCKM